MRGICHGEGLVAAVGLHGRHVKHEVEVPNSASLSGVLSHPALLPCGATNTAHIQVLFWNLHLAAHRLLFASIDAMSHGVLHEHLSFVAFPAK